MEEWIGQQWHRLVTRWAEPGHAAAAVSLDEMRKPLGLLLRCGGGPAGMRIGPAAARSHGGPRGWAQRVAGGGTRAALPELHGDLLALPPTVAVFADKALNRSLYLWLAALASQWGTVAAHHGDSWLSHNVAAARATLATFPGLATAYAQLRQAQLALRPSPGALRGPAAEAEAWVQRALRGEWDHGFPKDVAWPKGLTPTNVAPVWLWLEGCDTTTADAPRRQAQSPGDRSANDAAPLAPEDRTRRKAERVRDERHAAPLMLFFRAESILSWGEFTKVQRADDDSDDGNALEAARDMDVLSIAEDPGNANRLAARVRFDLDLPSAAADDVVLGPGNTSPSGTGRLACCGPRTAPCNAGWRARPLRSRPMRNCAPPCGRCAAAWRCCAQPPCAPTPRPMATNWMWMPGCAMQRTQPPGAASRPPCGSAACGPSAAWPRCCWLTSRFPPTRTWPVRAAPCAWWT